MRANILRTFGGGAIELNLENAMSCKIDCGFSISNNRIEFSFPFVIEGKNFNYGFAIDLDPEDPYFDNPKWVEGMIRRAQEVMQENMHLAVREIMVTLAKSSLYVAGLQIEPTKARLAERLSKSARREVSRQLRQKTGKTKVDESEYSGLLSQEKTLREAYQPVKRAHDRRFNDYREKRRSDLAEWSKDWEKYAKKQYPDLRFAYLLADAYTVTEVAHRHLASDYNVSISALERFILPSARRMARFPNLRGVERM